MKREIDLDDQVTKTELANVVASFFPEAFHLYCEFPSCYEDFREELGSLVHGLNRTQNPYEQTQRVVGVVRSCTPEILFEFFERSPLLHVTITNADVSHELQQEPHLKSEGISEWMQQREMNHITFGPDKLWLNVYEYGSK